MKKLLAALVFAAIVVGIALGLLFTLPSGFFELAAPPGGSLESGRELALADAGTFSDFDLYYLPDAPDGFELSGILDSESVPKDVPAIRIVHFIYLKRASDTEDPSYLFVENFLAATTPERVKTRHRPGGILVGGWQPRHPLGNGRTNLRRAEVG